MSIKKAILIGHLISTLPIVVIVFGFRWIGLTYFREDSWIFLIIGFLAAWGWWAYVIPRWRSWAIEKGAPEKGLRQWAALTGLGWPKGSISRYPE